MKKVLIGLLIISSFNSKAQSELQWAASDSLVTSSSGNIMITGTLTKSYHVDENTSLTMPMDGSNDFIIEGDTMAIIRYLIKQLDENTETMIKLGSMIPSYNYHPTSKLKQIKRKPKKLNPTP